MRCERPFAVYLVYQLYFKALRAILEAASHLRKGDIRMIRHEERLRVSENGRYLLRSNGHPFVWLGDTAWELFHALRREEVDHYLQTRAEQRFTVIQAVALAEREGLTRPNAYGRFPLLRNEDGLYDPALPDLSAETYDYWQHVDYTIDKAASLGLYMALLPTWGDKYNIKWGKRPEIFNPRNAELYGRWLGERYKEKPNVVWVLGGDRPLETRRHFEIQDAMARGVRAGDEGRHLITFHPCGGRSSSEFVHDEPWLDFNMMQSGHGDKAAINDLMIDADYGRQPVKPTLDGEPCYEDHPRAFKPENGYFDDYDVRRAAYSAVFAGAFGHTYGHHSVWCMCREPAAYFIMTWQDALRRPGAEQMRHLRSLLERDPGAERTPDPALLAANYEGANRMRSVRVGCRAFVYCPNGLPVTVRADQLTGGRLEAIWYDPRTGSTGSGGIFEAGEIHLKPPSSGRNNDWVLILEPMG